MGYQGGKHYQADYICAIINTWINKTGRTVVEPFCGSLAITEKIDGIVEASDAFKPLITMYQAMINGWIPPDSISKEEYYELKKQKDSNNPLTAFAGFGCGHKNYYFTGYTPRSGEGLKYDKCKAFKNACIKRIESSKDRVNFTCKDYRELNPINKIVYCDPPYINTEGYKHVGKFDTTEFWGVMDRWAENNIVLVSETIAPDDWKIIWEKEYNKINGKRIERLFLKINKG